MNPMTTFMKKQGVKVALPLLLFATACGEGAGPTAEGDVDLPLGDPTPMAKAATDSGLKLSTEGSAFDPAKQEIDLGDLDAKEAMNGVSDEANAGTAPTATEVAANGYDTKAAVPEPTTLAGLAIAALGLGAIKRKHAA